MVAINGNTYPVKDRLRAMGGRWDGARKAWMVPEDQADAARALVAGAGPATATAGGDRRPSEKPSEDARVKARATYKGKDYYVLASTKDGAKLLLAARNGAFQFWAVATAAAVTKDYGREERSTYGRETGRTEYPTLGKMMALAAEWREKSPDEREAARSRRTGCACGSREIGGETVPHEDNCDSCRFDAEDY